VKRVGTYAGTTGAETARHPRAPRLDEVRVEETPGSLSTTTTLHPHARLSPDVYRGASVAVGIAAHEAGHALQHAARYLPLELPLVPAAGIGLACLPVILLGFLSSRPGRAPGIVAFTLIALPVVTLPVEPDASRRVKRPPHGIVRTKGEAAGVSRVLDAAAMTYVAATAAAVSELIYLVLRYQGMTRDEA
jgi:hypothetical protein